MSQSYQEQAEAEIWESISQSAKEPEHSVRAPTVKQVYAIARVLLERLELEWPATCAAASALIARLRAGAEDGT